MDIVHHGARDGVTGSCHQLQIDADHSVLIDCGLFQGSEAGVLGDDTLAQGIDFDLSTVKALVVTHVHIDHVGRIPNLLAAGFKGPILCSEPSAILLPIVLEDAFKLGVTRDAEKIARYIQLVEQRIIALPYDHWFTLQDDEAVTARIRLRRAGHILGSAYVEIDLAYAGNGESRRVVFSGDLGAPHAPLLMPPKSPERADILVLESTYGDRVHEDRTTRRQRLEAVIERALADQGTVLIPAFSIGRTQELLYELEEIIHEKTSATPPVGAATAATARPAASSADNASPINWPQLPIILDSPLASRFTQAYRQLHDFWNAEAQEKLASGRRPLAFESLVTIDSHAEHIGVVNHLAQTARPAIVIAGGGMCTGGRIVNYLKAMLGDPRHNVLFVGYQAEGTAGWAIQQYGPKGGYVELDGERFDIRAGVAYIGGYSAHADQDGLIAFVGGMQAAPKEVRLVHGDREARRSLECALISRATKSGGLIIRSDI